MRGYSEDVALLDVVGLDEFEGVGLHEDGSRDDGHALGGVLRAYVDHVGLAGGVDVGEFL